MSLENFGSMLETQDEVPKLKEASKEDIKKVEESIKYSNKLTKVNNVLAVLDFPDNKEESFRKILEKQDNEKLIDLATKSKTDILTFLVNIKKNEKISNIQKLEDKEKIKENKIEKIDYKISKIKSIFTPEILNNNPEISEKLNEFDSLVNPLEKEAVLKDILWILKKPWKLESIINSIWWADKNNPQYQEFKNTLISIEPSFKDIFPELEKLHNNTAFPTKEVFNVDWWIVDIDLKDEKITAKEIWSEYAFEDKLDIEALNNISSECSREIKGLKNGEDVLKGAYAPFGRLLNQISSGENITELISNFDVSRFNELESVTSELNLDINITLSSGDIYELQNITDEKQLQLKLQSIKEKFIKLAHTMEKKEDNLKQKYHNEFSELLRQKAESKKLQIKVLKFFGDIGFDRIAKSKSDIIVDYINRNSWKFGLDSKMDFKNWNIGFNKDFWDKEIGSAEKVEFIKLFNRMLWSEVVDENIAYGTSSLSIEAIWEIQRLNNRTVGFFVGNLEKDKASYKKF